jgi:hypothetical protein
MDEKIRLYSLLQEQFAKYNAIFWQAPALVAANVLALDKLIGMPWALIGLAVFNLAMIWAFHRMVVAQGKIITATRAAEEDLSKSYPQYVASFAPHKAPSPSLRTRSGRRWLVLTMFLLDLWLLVFAVQLVTRKASATISTTLVAERRVWVLDQKTGEPKLVRDPLGIRTDTLASVEGWRDPKTGREWHRNQETRKLYLVENWVRDPKTGDFVRKW